MKENIPTLPLLIATYIIVHITHYFIGFEYTLHQEGIFTYKLIVDVLSWAVVYLLLRFLYRKLILQRIIHTSRNLNPYRKFSDSATCG